jgi:hydroxylysine kinase
VLTVLGPTSNLTMQAKLAVQNIEAQGALAGGHVRMESEEAITLLRDRYAIEGTARRVDTEKDDTFRVDSRCGGRFVLKASNPSEELKEVQFQTALLGHVATEDSDLPTPRPLKCIDGTEILEILDKARQRRYIRLMTYLDGVPLDGTNSSVGERTEIGKVLARLRLATARFRHPYDRRIYAWDVQHLLSLRPLLDHVRDEGKRGLLARGLKRFATIASQIPHLRTQVLHNDFSKSNIIVDHDAEQFVTGIIDFGDTVRTAIAIDVSTALLNQLPSDSADRHIDDLFEEGRPLLKGYLSIADLTQEELMLVPHFVMGRVVARALLTLWRAELFPENSRYILRNTEQGWGQLTWFLDRPIAVVSELLV